MRNGSSTRNVGKTFHCRPRDDSHCHVHYGVGTAVGGGGNIVQFSCDNKAVVSIVNKLYSQDVGLIHMLRCLVFTAARFNFWFGAIHKKEQPSRPYLT